jgi:hypothetical protein
MLYQPDNEFSEGALRALLIPIKEGTGISSVREIIDPSNTYELFCTIKHKKDKNDPERVYPRLSNIVFA